jgi:hypothetical protein
MSNDDVEARILNSESGTTSLDVEDQESLENKRKKTSIFSVVVFGLSGLSFVFQGFAIAYNVELLVVIISGVLASVVTSTATVKQIMMQRVDTLRVVHNQIRMEVNHFMEENRFLTSNVDNLEVAVEELLAVEQQLGSIAKKQNTTAEELMSLVKENKATLREQKRMAKAELQEQLLATVLRTDRDGDFRIDDREANVLILRMKNHGGIEFDEGRVRDALTKTDGSLTGLMTIIRDIGDGVDDEEDGDKGSRDSDSSRLINIDQRQFMNSIIVTYSQQLGSINSASLKAK